MTSERQNRVWFITGISRGLGLSLARRVLAEGDVVIGTTRGSRPDIAAGPGKLHVFNMDVTKPEEVIAVVRQAYEVCGRLDVVVNNAGYGLLGAIEESDAQDTKDVFAVNFLGTLNVVQAALPALREQRDGHIVNITSIAGIAPGAGSGLYAAAKFAVEGMSEALAQEVAPLGIRVTIIEPGAFRTDFLSEDSIRYAARKIADYELSSAKVVAAFQAMHGNQLGDPERAAEAIVRVVGSPEPPLRLLLGSDALRRTRAKLAKFEREIEDWEAVTIGTDYPELAASVR